VLAAPACSAETSDGSSGAPPPTARTAGLQRSLDKLVEDGAPGALLHVSDDGTDTTLQSGLADIDAGVPMGPDSRIRVGSMTKSYVSTLVLKLVEHDRLRLADKVIRYLPGLLADEPDITIRQLLDHTSGISEFNDDPRVLAPYLGGKLGHVWTPRQLVRISMGHPLSAQPGTAYHYSNANYVIAGLVVRKATGRSVAHQLRTRIFRPAGLDATTFSRSRVVPSPAVHGYFSSGGDPLIDITSLYPYPWASGAAVATLSDVADFYRGLLGGQFLPPRLMDKMRTTVDASAEDGAGARYGLGLARFTTPCGNAWGHGGNFAGYVGYAYSSPDGSRQTVLFLNADPSSLSSEVASGFKRLLDRAYCG
jgi:D-alanyl-D-alanine carboxypeptidase